VNKGYLYELPIKIFDIMRQGIKEFFRVERAQVSIEFILLVGGVVAAAIIFYSLGGSIRALGRTVSDWVGLERNVTISRITR
jgi:uncharacterized protein (UPF0333 family)